MYVKLCEKLEKGVLYTVWHVYCAISNVLECTSYTEAKITQNLKLRDTI